MYVYISFHTTSAAQVCVSLSVSMTSFVSVIIVSASVSVSGSVCIMSTCVSASASAPVFLSVSMPVSVSMSVSVSVNVCVCFYVRMFLCVLGGRKEGGGGLVYRVISHMNESCHRDKIGALMTRYIRGYGVASISRIDRIIGLFCKRAL